MELLLHLRTDLASPWRGCEKVLLRMDFVEPRGGTTTHATCSFGWWLMAGADLF
jgi:hypothetical protein